MFNFPTPATEGQKFTPPGGGPSYVYLNPSWRLAAPFGTTSGELVTATGGETHSLADWMAVIQPIENSNGAAGGDQQSIWGTSGNYGTGNVLDLRQGSAAAPFGSGGSVIKCTRTYRYTGATGAGDNSQNYASIIGHGYGLEGHKGQPIGVMGVAETVSTAPDEGGFSSDACGLYGLGKITGSGVGSAVGAFVTGWLTSPAGRIVALEVQAHNESGNAGAAYNPTGYQHSQAIWMPAAGNTDMTAGMVIATAGAQFSIGIAFTGTVVGSKTGGVKDTSIRDDSSSAVSLDIRGSHTIGIDARFGTLSGGVLFAPNNVSIIRATNGAGDTTHQLLTYNTSNIMVLGASAAGLYLAPNTTLADGANFLTGTTTGSRIGGTAGSKLGFFAATPVVRPTGVAVSVAAVHAALVTLGLIAA